jgi:hypothetical protein
MYRFMKIGNRLFQVIIILNFVLLEGIGNFKRNVYKLGLEKKRVKLSKLGNCLWSVEFKERVVVVQ